MNHHDELPNLLRSMALAHGEGLRARSGEERQRTEAACAILRLAAEVYVRERHRAATPAVVDAAAELGYAADEDCVALAADLLDEAERTHDPLDALYDARDRALRASRGMA